MRRLRQRAALLLLSVAGVAVSPTELRAQATRIRFEQLSSAHGLSQGTVNCLLQDRGGFLWLGTQEGLNRYDGYGFVVYKHDPAEATSLPASWIEALVEDPSGDVWVGTEGGGLARWRRATDAFVAFRHEPEDPASLPGNRVRALLVDRTTGDLWIGTFESGLARMAAADVAGGAGGAVRFDRFRHDPSDAASLSSDGVRWLFEDSAGDLWIGTLSGLNRFDRSRGTFVRFRHDPSNPASLSDDAVLSILEEHGGALWVGTENGLNRLERSGDRFSRYSSDAENPASLSHDYIRVLYQDRSRRLWIGTDGGLNVMSAAGGGRRFDRYLNDPADPSSLSNDRVMSIVQDRAGVMWIGTQGGGVDKFDPSTLAFRHYKADPSSAGGLSNNSVFAFASDARERLWIGTLGGLDALDRSTAHFTRFRHDPADRHSLADDRVAALLHDRQGHLWAGTIGKGLSRMDPASGRFRHYAPDPERPGALAGGVVTSLFEDRQGTLWVGTLRGGVNRFDAETGTFVAYRHDPARPESLSDNQVNAFAEDAEGRLWVGTFNGGLNRLERATGAWRHLRHDPRRPSSLSSDTVFSLHVDPAGVLWAGTQAGLNRLEGLDGEGAFRHWAERDGLANDTVWGIRSDASGRLWISTNGGLSRFDQTSETFKNYDSSHGLQSDEFNFGAHYRSSSGELFFGGVNGFNAFYPDRITSNDHVPPVVLTGLTRFNQPMVFDRPLFAVTEVDLSYRDHFLAFEFAALDFTAPRRNRYRYRLEGFDDAWVDLGAERKVTFASFEPGAYTLRVQGSNNDGVWNEEGLAIRLQVAPPFWQTWWFRSLAAAFVAAAAFGAYRVRTRAIRRRNVLLEALVKERTRELEEAQEELVKKEKLATLGELAASVAHEIRNPLGVIKNAAYLLGMFRRPDDEETREQLEQIDQELAYAGNIIRELLDFARQPAAGRKRLELQRAVEEALAAVEIPSGIELATRLDAEPVAVVADPDQVRSILVNLLLNGVQAIEDRGTLRVKCCRVRAEAVVTVIDTGVGIAEEEREKIFEPLYTKKARGIGLGLALSLRYARANGGRIEVDSEPGGGAIFRLALPLADEAPAVSGRSSPSG